MRYVQSGDHPWIWLRTDNSRLICFVLLGFFQDHYKTIIENKTYTDWESLLVVIKDEFIKYPLELGWNLTNRRPSNATQGNVLEAINVTMNLMQFHFLDRDLQRTGNSIVVVSPGCGVFEVDRGLAGITYQRMMDHGIGSDMLSLGLPPLHIAPFFLYNVSSHLLGNGIEESPCIHRCLTFHPFPYLE